MMYLKPLPTPVADARIYDRAGMWINATKGGIEVMDVTRDGPAARAAIAVGDVITRVNGKPVTLIPVYELRRRLRDEAPGTVVHFTIRHGGHARETAITLRDQI